MTAPKNRSRPGWHDNSANSPARCKPTPPWTRCWSGSPTAPWSNWTAPTTSASVDIQGKNIHTQAATDQLIETLDQEQYRLEDGPCVSSLREQITIRSNDLDKEERWPRWTGQAIDNGIRSMLCVQLFVQDDNLGALNILATKPDAFTDHDESSAMMLATHAAIAMKGRSVESHLRTALESRDLIGQGKGILMELYKISALEAFNLLVLASQRSHVKLHDIADALAATGELTTDNCRPTQPTTPTSAPPTATRSRITVTR